LTTDRGPRTRRGFRPRDHKGDTASYADGKKKEEVRRYVAGKGL